MTVTNTTFAVAQRRREARNIVDAAADDALAAFGAFAPPTLLVRLPWLDNGRRRVWGKLECWQTTGSFKIRGAFNALRGSKQGEIVVTASAGNHGLAIAHVAKVLGLQSVIYTPVGASETKLLRLQDMGVDVRQFGSDLFDASHVAIGTAARLGARYISPFDDIDVIVGQATIAVESLRQAERSFDYVVTPLGGGGLTFGVASVFSARSPNTRIIAAHPRVFGRDMTKGLIQERMTKPVVATIADGLAVQHQPGCWLGESLSEVVDTFVEVPEANVKAAMLALFHRQSLLVEGAGAIGIAPLLYDESALEIEGEVLIILSGGNVSASAMAQAMATEIHDPALRRKLGLRSIALPTEISLRVTCAPLRQESVANATTEPSFLARGELWATFLKDLSGPLESANRETEQIFERGRVHGCPAESIEERTLTTCSDLVRSLIEHDPLDEETAIRQARLATQLIATIRTALRWSSAASDSVNSSFLYDPTNTGIGQINYDRYGSVLLLEAESELLNILGMSADRTTALLTSSGQAAYATVESFLLREVAGGRLKISTAPYIYFEAAEQLSSLPFVHLAVSRDWSAQGLFNFLIEIDWDVLFVDPMANFPGLPTVDLSLLAKLMQGQNWSNRWFIIDGTLVSGGINPFSVFEFQGAPRIIYYESASKYLQFGLDLQMAGLIVTDKDTARRLNVHRRNLGSIMYPYGVNRFPFQSRAMFLSRMAILTRNCEELVRTIVENDKNNELMVGFPANWRHMGWRHGGGLVTITFLREGLNNRIVLERLIEMLMHRCERSKVAMAKGVSFGFSTTRVSAAAAMAGTTDPFLRFSLGDHDEAENRRLCDIVAQTLQDFCDEDKE